MSLSRKGCCDKQRKPCSYHEGAQDMSDAIEIYLRQRTDAPDYVHDWNMMLADCIEKGDHLK
jgi:hypothetical protein